MDPFQFFFDYFIAPIDERVGYNPVNTLAYAAIALIAAYLIFKLFEKLKIKVDKQFVYSIIPYIFFGAALRVVVDADILPYSYITVTPGIYFVVGFLTLGSVLFFSLIGKRDMIPTFGVFLTAVPLALLLPLLTHMYHATIILVLVGAGVAAAHMAFKRFKFKEMGLPLVLVASHALDGAATFVTIDIFSHDVGLNYFEQHVFTNALASAFGGFWAFYVIKIAFAIAAAYLLETSKDLNKSEKYYVYLLLIIFGLAPGLRDILRMACGV